MQSENVVIMFVNSFSVPEDREEEFISLWREVNASMVVKAGYVDHHLHRSIDPTAAFRFVNFARWESADAWSAAHDADFRDRMRDPRWKGISATPVLYESEPLHAGDHSDVQPPRREAGSAR